MAETALSDLRLLVKMDNPSLLLSNLIPPRFFSSMESEPNCFLGAKNNSYVLRTDYLALQRAVNRKKEY